MQTEIKRVCFSSVTRQFLPTYAFLKEGLDDLQRARLEQIRQEQWIVDTDCGVDDTSAIFVALHYLNPLAFLATSGNTGRQNVARNVAKIQELKGKKVQIWMGASRPLLQRKRPVPEWHGQDGIGDSEHTKQYRGYLEMIEGSHQESAFNGVTKLVDLINKHPGQINLIVIGPLSTLATAVLLDRTICAKVKSVHIMGGNYKGLGNQGPERPSVQYNFGADPEAAQIVMKGFGNIILVPWEAIQEQKKYSTDYTKKILFDENYACCKFLEQVNKDMMSKEKYHQFFICDVVTTAAIVDPNCILRQSRKKGRVITDVKSRRGELLVEEDKDEACNNILVIQQFDTQRVVDILEGALK